MQCPQNQGQGSGSRSYINIVIEHKEINLD